MEHFCPIDINNNKSKYKPLRDQMYTCHYLLLVGVNFMLIYTKYVIDCTGLFLYFYDTLCVVVTFVFNNQWIIIEHVIES